jgi:hypothetical protein
MSFLWRTMCEYSANVGHFYSSLMIQLKILSDED